MEGHDAGQDWFAQSEARVARLKKLASDLRQSDGTPMSERLAEIKEIEEAADDNSRPSREDKEALLRRLEHKYGKRSPDQLRMLAIRDALRQMRAFGKEMGKPAPQDLAAAVVHGDLAKVRKLVAAGVSVNSVGAGGHSLLMEAGIQGHAEIAAELRRAGARVGLLEAAVLGDEKAARECIENGAEVDQASANGLSALGWATGRGHLAVVSLLLAHGACVDAPSKSGHTPLLLAALHDRHRVVEALVAAGAQVGVVETAMLGRIAEITEMLDSGVDIETRNSAGHTPLMAACAAGQVECARFLLEHGADMNAASSYGNTALIHSIVYGRGASIELLLDWGVDVNAAVQTDNEHLRGRTPLHMACQIPARAEIVQILLSRGADPNRPNGHGDTPLHQAASRGSADALKVLLEAGGDPAAHGWFGRTPLHCAADRGSVECARDLLDHGAEIDATADRGQTPLALAASGGHLEVLQLLVARGADVNARGEDDFGAMAGAAFNGHTGVTRYLREHGAVSDAASIACAGLMGRDAVLGAMLGPWARRTAFHAATGLGVTIALMYDLLPHPGAWLGILTGIAIMHAPRVLRPAARMWWIALAAAVLCMFIAVSRGPHSAGGWVFAIAAALPYGVCAARRPPVSVGNRRIP